MPGKRKKKESYPEGVSWRWAERWGEVGRLEEVAQAVEGGFLLLINKQEQKGKTNKRKRKRAKKNI